MNFDLFLEKKFHGTKYHVKFVNECNMLTPKILRHLNLQRAIYSTIASSRYLKVWYEKNVQIFLYIMLQEFLQDLSCPDTYNSTLLRFLDQRHNVSNYSVRSSTTRVRRCTAGLKCKNRAIKIQSCFVRKIFS